MLPITLLLVVSLNVFATQPDQKNLPIGFAPHEPTHWLHSTSISEAPVAPVHSLGEWEDSDSAVTLWTNPSFVKALVAKGPVTLIGDSQSEITWWQNWLRTNNIESQNVRFLAIATDSIWIRDYGPWYIVDGHGDLGIVDTIYNRPRPTDDAVPGHLARHFQLPLYETGLVHTGGNYYSDGLGSAFSSTLVFRENSSLSASEIYRRMVSFLGVDRYVTEVLAPQITIEHLDTFGKLVAPDTWVFSEFPQGSVYRKYSEAMVAKLQALVSPYGTPYKIYRLKMVARSSGWENYRAYINSFISNRTLYFPAYGDSSDTLVKETYQKALPGYDIVGVNGRETAWGDSVHCRANNFYRKNTIFIFPKIQSKIEGGKPISITANIFPSPGAEITKAPEVYWKVNGVGLAILGMEKTGANQYHVNLPAAPSGSKVSFFIMAVDSQGIEKHAPVHAPYVTIDVEIP